MLGYNLVCFVAFLVLLYWLARSVWNDRWAALFTLGVALLHPLTFAYTLYLKDADMLCLVTGVLAVVYGYFVAPPERMSVRRAIVLGTLLGWLFLDRPNVGGGFVLYFGLVVVRRVWRGRADLGAVLRTVATRELLVFVVAAAWCAPFAIHSMAEWGSPFFTANAAYQTPLGTRFAMDTDTWYKYSEPGHLVTLGSPHDGSWLERSSAATL